MLGALTVIVIFQLAGELLAKSLALPLPGPVLGMALLFLTLLVRGKVSQELRSGTSSLLQHLSLLFVPAGVGVVVHLQRVADEWLPIVAATVISTFIGLGVTALIICAMTRQPVGEKS